MGNCDPHHYLPIHQSGLKTLRTLYMHRGYGQDIVVRGRIVTLCCSQCGDTIRRSAEVYREKRPSSGG